MRDITNTALGTFSPIRCGTLQTPSIQTQCPHCVQWDCGVKQTNTLYEAKQIPTSGLRISFDTICNNLHQIFGLSQLFYLIKMSLYIYSIRNILPYPMWDITNATSANGGINYPYNATAISPFVSSISSLTKQMVSERALLHFSWRTKRRVLLDSPFSPLDDWNAPFCEPCVFWERFLCGWVYVMLWSTCGALQLIQVIYTCHNLHFPNPLQEVNGQL